MISELDITNRRVAMKVLSIQKDAYEIEAEYIGTREIPPLKETLKELMDCGESFIGYFEGDKLAGVLSYKYWKGVIDLHRVMVHPFYFRRGIAKRLIAHVESQFPQAQLMIVSTGAKNEPAVKLYRGLGFELLDETVFAGEVAVANFKKKLKRDS